MAAEPPTDRDPDDHLLRRVAGGDQEAFGALFRRRHPDVFRFAFHMTGSPATADDVVQDVFLIVMRGAARYDSGRATVAAWLCGIARNCVRQRLSRDNRFALTGCADDLAEDNNPAGAVGEATDPLAGLLRTERINILRRAIRTLPLPYREALVLCDLQERPYADVAEIVGCPTGTVRSRLHRARALLAAKITASRAGAIGDESASPAAGRADELGRRRGPAGSVTMAGSGGGYL